MNKLLVIPLLAILVSLKSWAYDGVPPQKNAKDFLTALKKAPSKVVLSDGSFASSSSVIVNRKWKGDLCEMSVKNISTQPLSISEVVVFDLQHGLNANTPVYGEGFQKLAQIGGTLAKPEDWGTYTDRNHYKIPEPEKMRTAYGMLTLQVQPNDRLLLATTSCNKFISRFSFDAMRLRISMDCEHLTLQPGEEWNLEEFMAIAGSDREKLYDRLTAAINVHHPKMNHSEPMGWCSWACYGPHVTAKNVSDNAQWIAQNLPQLKYIQIDDGYQPWMGDWLDAGKAFGGNITQVLNEIKSKNLEAALWVAPFIASPESKIFKEHPDWMVKDSLGNPLRSDKIGFGGWRQGPWYVLDGTHPQVQAYLTQLFKTLKEKWGCTYFKLDANYWGAIHGGVHYDKAATRIEAYRRGMEAIRKGSGDAFLLGCNHPVWASLGLIHGSRSSMDIAPNWNSFKSVGKENLLRGWQNGRLWWNDPDCILLSGKGADDVVYDAGGKAAVTEPGISENEFQFHATVIYATGGMLLSGDDLTKITPAHLAMLKKIVPPTGTAARFENEKFEVGVSDLKNSIVYSVFNWGDTAVQRVIKLPRGRYQLTNKWGGHSIGIGENEYHVTMLMPHSALLIEATKIQ
ncbi:glycoside hydrolase family 36 protein [Pinibacter soli]|uniref:Alpha-galactosidase n=1 Tax=Pinibacter soli TaxID=3044211 RepID=A0ABT6RBA4_9BACT|nr:glycoside hydrolase family 36 protein [Pinibacter soli]MDI3319835.1 alpha-galactosidase [Pinibacter soli]